MGAAKDDDSKLLCVISALQYAVKSGPEREASEQEERRRWRKGEGGSKDSERLDGVEWGLVLRVVVGVGGLVEDVENLVLLFLA